jgi:hypothetical protein
MAEGMRVSGVGKGARRTDLDRAARIQRDAKIQNATNGAYGQRAELEGLAQGAPMQGSFDPARVRMGEERSMNAAASIPTVGIFEPTRRPEESLTAGVDVGDGPGSEVLMTPVDAPDQLSTFVRAMYMANPTPQLRRMVEAFEEEAR